MLLNILERWWTGGEAEENGGGAKKELGGSTHDVTGDQTKRALLKELGCLAYNI